MRPAPCLALCVLAIGVVGCSAPPVRPDAEVARIVEREDRRQRPTVAVAELDLQPLELASAGVALEALELLYVPNRGHQNTAPASARAPVPAGWHEAPASWLGYPGPVSTDAEELRSVDPEVSAISFDTDAAPSSDEDGDRRGGGGKRPRVRLNFLNLKINDNPISFSGSLKGMGNLQLRATIRF